MNAQAVWLGVLGVVIGLGFGYLLAKALRKEAKK